MIFECGSKTLTLLKFNELMNGPVKEEKVEVAKKTTAKKTTKKAE